MKEPAERHQPQAIQQFHAPSISSGREVQQCQAELPRGRRTDARRGRLTTTRQHRPRVVEVAQLYGALAKHRVGVHILAEPLNGHVDLTHTGVECRLADFGEPDQGRFLVNPRSFEMLRQDAERARWRTGFAIGTGG